MICVEKWVAKGPGSRGGFLIKPGCAVTSLPLNLDASGLIRIIDMIRARLSSAEREQRVKPTAIWDGDEVRIRISAGLAPANSRRTTLAGLLQGYRVSIEPEQVSKEARADAFAAQCECGMVKLVEGAWNQAFIDELCAFPNGAHDDQVDAASVAFRALVRRVTWSAVGV